MTDSWEDRHFLYQIKKLMQQKSENPSTLQMIQTTSQYFEKKQIQTFTLVKRAYKICTQDHLLEMELEHLKKVFIEVNNFPLAVVKRIIKKVEHENPSFSR